MIDKEKLINELQQEIGRVEYAYKRYRNPEFGVRAVLDVQLLRDVIELLKEQDKIIKSLTEENERLLSERIAELQRNTDALHAIMQDTILVNNAIEQRKGG